MSTRHEREADTKSKDKHIKILKDLMARPENKKCSECRKKDPRWASWNLGIFFCIRCSGVHRNLGTHISKVKSADLDTWTPEQIENMIKWGNVKANMYWEAKLPANYAVPEEKVEEFIRDKYQWKKYAAEGSLPDPDTLVPGQVLPAPVVAPAVVHAAAAVATAAPVSSNGTFASFGAPSAPAAQAASTSASNDLFAAFGAPAVASAPVPNKNAILSLYGATPSPSTSAAPGSFSAAPLAQPNFASFGSFSSAPAAAPASNAFAAFSGMTGHQSTSVSSAPSSTAPGGGSMGGFANFGGFASGAAAQSGMGAGGRLSFSTPATAPSSIQATMSQFSTMVPSPSPSSMNFSSGSAGLAAGPGASAFAGLSAGMNLGSATTTGNAAGINWSTPAPAAPSSKPAELNGWSAFQ